MRISLRYRLLIPVGLLLSGIGAASVWGAKVAAEEAERRTAEQLWAIARTLNEPPTFPLTSPVLHHLKGFSGAEFLLIGPTSRVSTLNPPPPLTALEVAISSENEPSLGSPIAIGGEEYHCVRHHLRAPHPQEGSNLYIFYPETRRRLVVREAIRTPLVLGLVAGIVAVVLTLTSGSSLVRRIRTLEQRTRQIAHGDFQPMPLPRSDDELRDLCQSVNEMACKIAELQRVVQRTERLRLVGQFSGGLAHQLRNAAAGAKLSIEVYLAENPQADAEPLEVALRQLDRIERNLRQFLTVGAKAEYVPTVCDLRSLIEQSVSLFRPQCQHAGQTLAWLPPPGAMPIQGDAQQLVHLLTNVLGNAVEAAGPGGDIRVTATTNPGQYLIEVSDNGPGPPVSIADRLFEPFVTGKEQGIGLGLAVARQVVEAHRGTLTWRRFQNRTIFTISLPMTDVSETSSSLLTPASTSPA